MTNRIVPAALLSVLLAAPAVGQDEPAGSAPETDAPVSAGADDAAPPSLDDLLGIEGDAGEAEQATEEAAEAELERRLDDAAVGHVFLAAVERMREVAERLDARFDTGLGTQRAQEDVLAKLEQLIDEAKKRQGSASCSNPSQSSNQQQQSQQTPGKQSRAGQQEQQGQQRNPSPQTANDGEAPPPQHGELGTLLDESRSEWGHLPEREREMLLQGRREKFSSLYEQMTREYYRRLAEEG